MGAALRVRETCSLGFRAGVRRRGPVRGVWSGERGAVSSVSVASSALAELAAARAASGRDTLEGCSRAALRLGQQSGTRRWALVWRRGWVGMEWP